MAVFEYQAIAKGGKTVKGVIDAETAAAARRKLRDQQLYPTSIGMTTAAEASTRTGKKEVRFGSFGRVGVRDVSLMTRQFATLLRAGMAMVEALNALIEQTTKARLKKTLYDVRDKVNAGSSLADALAQHPRVFTEMYVNMVRAGEASGTLEQVLLRLAEVLEHQAKLRARLGSTLAYPAFLALFAVGIIVFLMLVIVPKLTQIFEKQEQELPDVTKALINTSHFIGTYWMFMIGGVLALFLLWRVWVSRPAGRMQWDKLKLHLPVYRRLYVKVIGARFTRTLGTMLQSGLTMLVALDVVRSVMGNRHVEELLDDVRGAVRRGRDLSVPLKEMGVFPPMVIHMIELGQRSGEMEEMLVHVAEQYDEDVRLTLDAFVSLLEPMIIIVMGIFVGFLVLAILLPILNMSTNI